MKSKFYFIALLLTIGTYLLADGQVSNYSPGDKVSIVLNTGAKYNATIIEIDSTFIKISISGFNSVLKYKREDVLSIQKLKIAQTGSFGVGLGVGYGILGFNGEFNIGDHLAFTAGLGTTIFAGLGYNVGVRGYILKRESMFRPRIGIHYGTSAMITDIDLTAYVPNSNYSGQQFSGLAFSAGSVVWLSDTHRYGFSFDVVYIGYNNEFKSTLETINYQIAKYNKLARDNAYGYYYQYEQIKMPSPIRISLGCRLAF